MTRYTQPQAGPLTLDSGNPITQGITSVILPGVGSYEVVSAALLPNKSGTTSIGSAISGRVLQLTSNQASIYTTATVAQRSASGSILWAGDLFASPSGDACLGGITNNSANTAPYVMMELKRNYSGTNSSRIYLSLSTGGVVNNNNLSSSANYTSGTNCIFIGTATSGNQTLYTGKIGQSITQDANTIVAGSLSSSSTSRLEVGDSLNARNPQAACAIQITWNRALSAVEVASLAKNPWQIFLDEDTSYFNVVAGGTTNYTLSGTAGNYSYTGQVATLTVNRKLSGTFGSYTYTGQSATFKFGHFLNGAYGSYSITGQTALLKVNRFLSGTNGNYSYTGQAATLTYSNGHNNYTLSGATGSYTYTGQTAQMVRSVKMSGSAGNYTYTGQSGTFSKQVNLTGAYGTYTYSGQTATLKRNVVLSGSYGTYTYTGKNATLTYTAGSIGGYPPPNVVKFGVMYGPTGTEYTGTYIGSTTVEVTTGQLVRPLTSKLSILT